MQLMKTIVNIIVIVLLFMMSDIESESILRSVLVPILLLIATGVFIYRYYKKRGHDDSPSHPGGGFF